MADGWFMILDLAGLNWESATRKMNSFAMSELVLPLSTSDSSPNGDSSSINKWWQNKFYTCRISQKLAWSQTYSHQSFKMIFPFFATSFMSNFSEDSFCRAKRRSRHQLNLFYGSILNSLSFRCHDGSLVRPSYLYCMFELQSYGTNLRLCPQSDVLR